MFAPLRTLRGLCYFAIVTLAGAPIALAQQPDAAPFRVALKYTSSVAECPTAPQLRQAVETELGHDPFDEQATDQVTVAITGSGSQLRAEIGLPQRSREAARVRVLSGPRGDCKELVRALTLALCLVIDPLHVESARRASTTNDAEAGDEAQPSGASSSSTAARGGAQVPKSAKGAEGSGASGSTTGPLVKPGGVGAYVQLSALASTGLAPGAGFGSAFELGARRGPLSLGVEGRFDLPRQAAFQTGTLSVSPRVLSIVPCWLLAPFVACGLLSGGELLASGSGFPVNHRGGAPIFGAGLRVALEAPLNHHLHLSAFAEAQALLDRAQFIANRSVVWRAEPVFAELGVSGVVLF